MDASYYQHLLVDEKEQLERQLADLSDEHARQSLKDATGELSSYDQHPADLASELMERDTDFALKEQKRIRLGEIDAALERINAGTYGSCAHCGQMISSARLEAYPTAKYCLECALQAESESPERLRPVEEEVIPFHDFSNLEEEIDDID